MNILIHIKQFENLKQSSQVLHPCCDSSLNRTFALTATMHAPSFQSSRKGKNYEVLGIVSSLLHKFGRRRHSDIVDMRASLVQMPIPFVQ